MNLVKWCLLFENEDNKRLLDAGVKEMENNKELISVTSYFAAVEDVFEKLLLNIRNDSLLHNFLI